jgi:hypothetical protein
MYEIVVKNFKYIKKIKITLLNVLIILQHYKRKKLFISYVVTFLNM